jgi:hypothetical protein
MNVAQNPEQVSILLACAARLQSTVPFILPLQLVLT